MKPIKKINAIVSTTIDLSPTARDIVLSLSEPLPFIAGSFVNVFIKKEGVVQRRAFSISSSDQDTNSITLSVRLNPKGAVTPLFWQSDIIGTTVEVMGPLGLNTADKMPGLRIFLFGYGIGAGVVKSLAEHFVTSKRVTEITVITGSKSKEELIHKDFFDALVIQHSHVHVTYIVSNRDEVSEYKKGYIQDNLTDLNFSNADVYVCGQEVACNALVDTVKKTNPINCNFFVEGFH